MSDSAAIRAGRAFVELYADDTKLEKGLKGAEGKLKSWGLGIAKVGAAVFGAGAVIKGALDASIVAFAEVGSSLAHMSERTGIGVESLSQLSFAAGQTGVDMETLEGGVRKMQKTLGAAAGGNKEAQKSLEDIGLTVEELINLAPEEQFKRIADRLSQIHNPAQRAAATMAIFGKTGTSLLPMLDLGSAGIERLMKTADELGLTMSEGDAAAAEELHASLSALWATVRGLSVAIGGALAPRITDLVQRGARAAGLIVNWVKENRDLIVTVSTIATAVAGAGVAIVAIGAGIYGLGAAIGFAAVPFTLLWGLIAGTFGAIIGVLGFVLSPIGLIVAAVVGLGAYFAATSGAIKTALTDLSDGFDNLAGDFKVAFSAMKAALSAGDFGAAAKVLWALLKLEWVRGTAYLQEKWLELKGSLGEIWDVDLFYGLKGAWIEVMAFMRKAWVELQRAMLTIAAPTQNWIAQKFTGLFAWMQGLKAEDVQKSFEEDQARRGGTVTSGKQLDDQLAGINADRDKALAENDRQHGDARHKYDLEHAPGQAASEHAKSKAETDAEEGMAKASKELAAAAKAAEESTKKTHPTLKKAADASEDAVATAGKVTAGGTFNAFALGLLGMPFDAMKELARQSRMQTGLQTTMVDELRNGGRGARP